MRHRNSNSIVIPNNPNQREKNKKSKTCVQCEKHTTNEPDKVCRICKFNVNVQVQFLQKGLGEYSGEAI
jgi:hypothetical protein